MGLTTDYFHVCVLPELHVKLDALKEQCDQFPKW